MYSIVQVVFDYLRNHGEWPRYRQLEVALWREKPIQQSIRETDPEYLRVETGHEGRIKVTLPGLLECEESEDVLRQVLTFAQLLGERYQQSGGGEAEVESTELARELRLSEHDLCVLREVLHVVVSGGLWSSGGRSRDPCHFSYSAGDKAYLFQNVRTIPDYLAASKRSAELRSMEDGVQDFPWLSPRRTFQGKPIPGPSNLGVTNWSLHPAVVMAAAQLFNSGAYGEAIRAAFQAFEAFIQKLSGSDLTGSKLMGRALQENGGVVPLEFLDQRLGKGAQEGLKLLAMGAMMGIRNPHSHGPPVEITRDEAVEQLGFASFLFRRLEDGSGVEAYVEEEARSENGDLR